MESNNRLVASADDKSVKLGGDTKTRQGAKIELIARTRIYEAVPTIQGQRGEAEFWIFDPVGDVDNGAFRGGAVVVSLRAWSQVLEEIRAARYTNAHVYRSPVIPSDELVTRVI